MLQKLKKRVYNLLHTYEYVAGKTKFYHKGQGKSRVAILLELLAWQIRENDFNKMYYAFGLNQKGTKIGHFIGNNTITKIKVRAENLIKQKIHLKEISFDIITRDKFYCGSILKANGIPCLEILALISNGIIFPISAGLSNVRHLLDLDQDEYFVKNVIKESGEGVFPLRLFNNSIFFNNQRIDQESLLLFLKFGTWVVQKKYYSHKCIRNINKSALNTTRIYTIIGSSGPEYLGGFQAFATNEADTDSWGHGSVYVGIDLEMGVLRKYGITSLTDKRPGIMYSHPDSLIEFKSYPLPFLKESLELCLKAHTLFYCNFIIGWDVAITDEGPLIVEANETPGINVLQCLNDDISKKVKDKYNELLKIYGSN